MKFVSEHLVDTGEVDDIFLGMREVVVRRYRFYPPSDYLSAYPVRVLSGL